MTIELSNLPPVQSQHHEQRRDELSGSLHVDAHPLRSPPLPHPPTKAPRSSPRGSRRRRRRRRAEVLSLSPPVSSLPPLPASPPQILTSTQPAPLSLLALTRQEGCGPNVPSPGCECAAPTHAKSEEHSVLEQTDLRVFFPFESYSYGAGAADKVWRWLSLSSSSASSSSSSLSASASASSLPPVPTVPRLVSLQPASYAKGPVGERTGASDPAPASLAVGAAASASQGGGSDETVLARGEGEARPGPRDGAGVSEAADVVFLSLSSASSKDRDRNKDWNWDWRYTIKKLKELRKRDWKLTPKSQKKEEEKQQQQKVIQTAPAVTTKVQGYDREHENDLEAQHQRQHQNSSSSSSSSSVSQHHKNKPHSNHKFSARTIFVTFLRLLIIAALVFLCVYMMILFEETMRKQIDRDIEQDGER